MPVQRPAYRLTLGSVAFTSGAAAPSGNLATAAAGALGLNAAATESVLDGLRVDADLEAPGSLDAWFGKATALTVAAGDAAGLQLGYGSSLSTVFVGTVQAVEPDLARLRVRALTDDAKLSQLRINQVYENQDAGQIVSDLASQAGLSTGRVQSGLDFPFYVVDDARTAYRHCRDLAERAGFNMYVSSDGDLTFAAFDKVTADHSFSYAKDVLSLQVSTSPPAYQAVEVWGESPASAEGLEAASWLVRDFSGSAGSAGSGASLRLTDVAIRTRDAAGSSARGRLADLTRRATFGLAVVLGSPQVVLGDAVTFDGVPDDRLAGVFQVKRVSHTFSKPSGFTTRLELWAGGGGSLLAGLP
jgi:phage protein D